MTDSKTDALNTEKEIKELPDLAQFENQEWFKTAYDAHKSDEYRTMLDELGVGYHTSDNKTALTYRYLEATKGLQTDAPAGVTKNENPNAETKPMQGQELPQTVSPVTEAKVNDQSEPKAAPIKPAEAKPTAKTENKTETKTETTPSKSEAIAVKSKLGRDVLEPATGTRIIAGKTTKITPTVMVARERILSNLKQLNALNGNQLAFDE